MPADESVPIGWNFRAMLIVSGALAVLAGVIMLFWPIRSAVATTAIIAGYAVVGGIVYGIVGVTQRGLRGWSRVAHLFLAVLYVAAGIVSFSNLAGTTKLVSLVVVVIIGISWVLDGIVALTTLGPASSRGWTIVYAAVAIIAGLIVLYTPLISGLALWLVFAVALVLLGVSQLVRAVAVER